MNAQTDNAIAKLQQLIPVAAVIYVPKIEYAIDALLASAEREQVQQQRISMLEQRLREQDAPEPHRNAQEALETHEMDNLACIPCEGASTPQISIL